ncbi:hypothetical protein KO529_18110 [Arenibacter algicola]|uniref:hypothetical protein n=1 Tax=Arenibacter algicola TaxID=616991 RepID=UPI001C07C223|nr:hypothetical protein [Arenibacter algicola]MBU2906719.1 hypothetical protein [Arenibacter algicola]
MNSKSSFPKEKIGSRYWNNLPEVGGCKRCPLFVPFDNRFLVVLSIDQTENVGEKSFSRLINCMISLFQILNKNKNSKKILKVKKCENVDFFPSSILPEYSGQELNNIFQRIWP